MPRAEGYSPQEAYITPIERVDVADIEEARDMVREALEHGMFPILTVPKKYAEEVRKGLVPHSTWIGEPLLAGTLHREPYMPDDKEERIMLKIKIDSSRVEPRFTGPDRHYHGVVVLKGPISPEEIEELTNLETLH